MMTGVPQSWGWGAWVVGDLTEILRRASSALDNDVRVDRVVISPPSGPGDLPEVRLQVSDDVARRTIWRRLEAGEHPVEFFGRPTDVSWIAEVQGLLLTVSAGQEVP